MEDVMATQKPKVENHAQSTQSKVTPHPSPPSDQANFNEKPSQTGTGSTFEKVPLEGTGQVERTLVVVPHVVPKGF